MTAPLPPLPLTDRTLAMPATDYEPEWISSMEGYSEDDLREYAKLAVHEALERATDAMHHAGVNTWEDAVLILRAMIEEYK